MFFELLFPCSVGSLQFKPFAALQDWNVTSPLNLHSDTHLLPMSNLHEDPISMLSYLLLKTSVQNLEVTTLASHSPACPLVRAHPCWTLGLLHINLNVVNKPFWIFHSILSAFWV